MPFRGGGVHTIVLGQPQPFRIVTLELLLSAKNSPSLVLYDILGAVGHCGVMLYKTML
jgi:hypothetical protein